MPCIILCRFCVHMFCRCCCFTMIVLFACYFLSSNDLCYILIVTDVTYRGRGTHICVGNLTIIGSGNGLSPGQRQAIIWTNAGILLIGPLGTNFSEIPMAFHTFSVKKIRLKMSSAKWLPCCLGLNVLNQNNLMCLVTCFCFITWTLHCNSNSFLSDIPKYIQ